LFSKFNKDIGQCGFRGGPFLGHKFEPNIVNYNIFILKLIFKKKKKKKKKKTNKYYYLFFKLKLNVLQLPKE